MNNRIKGESLSDHTIDALRYCYNDIITTMHYSAYCKKSPNEIEKVIFHEPATIVYWSNGTKTVVKCSEDDCFDPEKGLAMAICKRFLGDKYKDIFKEYLPKEEEKEIPKVSTQEAVDALVSSVNNLKSLAFRFKVKNIDEKD